MESNRERKNLVTSAVPSWRRTQHEICEEVVARVYRKEGQMENNHLFGFLIKC